MRVLPSLNQNSQFWLSSYGSKSEFIFSGTHFMDVLLADSDSDISTTTNLPQVKYTAF